MQRQALSVTGRGGSVSRTVVAWEDPAAKQPLNPYQTPPNPNLSTDFQYQMRTVTGTLTAKRSVTCPILSCCSRWRWWMKAK